jgi:uncharacterized YigZ family protein
MSEDTFISIAGPATASVKTRGSRFIGDALPVRDEEAAEAAIAAVRKRRYGASHHCSAYRLGPVRDRWRHHDDGEPHGTGGAPILRQIDARALTDTLVVVTRYFGGMKLGKGGLARAYGEAAERALDAARMVTHIICERARVSFEYDDTAPAMGTLQRFEARVVDSEYLERTVLTVDVPRSRFEAFAEAFAEALGARGTLESAA